jgi:hypothetical protein
MKEIWCPYSDKYCKPSDSNKEHIIPLALGGNNKFKIWVNTGINSRLGTRLDGKIANHPLVESARRYYRLLGRRKKVPEVEWLVKYNGLRATLDLSKKYTPTHCQDRKRENLR